MTLVPQHISYSQISYRVQSLLCLKHDSRQLIVELGLVFSSEVFMYVMLSLGMGLIAAGPPLTPSTHTSSIHLCMRATCKSCACSRLPLLSMKVCWCLAVVNGILVTRASSVLGGGVLWTLMHSLQALHGLMHRLDS